MKTILVTGGAGFIGSNFIRYWVKKHPNFKVINFDKLTYAGNLDNLKDVSKNKNYKFIRGDICDTKKVDSIFKKYRPNYLVNFAAETHVDRSIHNGAKVFLETNIDGTYTILETIKNFGRPGQSGIEKAVFVSTDEVYGSLEIKSKEKFTETSPLAPNSPYSAAKAAADLLCRAYYQTWGLPIIVTHCSNNYGPYTYPEKMIPFFTLQALADKPLPVYANGSNVRDWIHVLDHARGIELALLKGKAGETYNMGGDTELSNIEVATKILDILKKPYSLIKYVADRPGHDKRYAIDHAKISKELGWRPKYKFQKMLPETINWYRDNKMWVKKVQAKAKKFNKHINI